MSSGPQSDRGEGNGDEEISGELVVACCTAAAVLLLVEEVFHEIALPADVPSVAPLDLFAMLRRHMPQGAAEREGRALELAIQLRDGAQQGGEPSNCLLKLA
jgi:hypothetical protein